MDEIIPNSDQNVNNMTMTSKQIAELTNKRHDHVLRDIKELVDKGVICLPKIGETSDTLKSEQIFVLDSQGKKQPAYQLTKRDTLVLTSGYSAQQRAAIIDRWLELESAPKAFDPSNLTRLEILTMAIESEKKVIELQKENDVLYIENQTQKHAIEYQKPLADFGSALCESKSLIPTTQLAATQGIQTSAQILNRFLCEENVIRKVNGVWVLTAYFQDKGFGKMVAFPYTNKDGEKCTNEQLRWTQEGRKFVLELWKKRNSEVKK